MDYYFMNLAEKTKAVVADSKGEKAFIATNNTIFYIDMV